MRPTSSLQKLLLILIVLLSTVISHAQNTTKSELLGSFSINQTEPGKLNKLAETPDTLFKNKSEGLVDLEHSSIILNSQKENTLIVHSEAVSVIIYSAWWTNEYDNDGDGYVQSTSINWDADVSGSLGSQTVFAKLYYKSSVAGNWEFVTTTENYSITGNSSSDSYYVNLHNVSFGLYDWRIDIFRAGETSFDQSYGPEDNPDLNEYAMETAGEDVVPGAYVQDAWWSGTLDADNDGYTRMANLNYSLGVSDGISTLSVFERVYWKLSTSSSWNLITETDIHEIYGVVNLGPYTVDIETTFDHNLYDFRIEVFQEGESSPDVTYGPSENAELDDFPFETSEQDVEVRAVISDVVMTDELDSDGDVYVRSARLQWASTVSDGYSELDCWINIYYKVSASDTWIYYSDFSHLLLSGNLPTYCWILLDNMNHAIYDWKIEVNSLEQNPQEVIHVITNYPMENKVQDLLGDANIVGPESICEGSAATFTATADNATSWLWEVPTGWVLNSGQGSSSVNITSGENSGNVCVTPSSNVGTGAIKCTPVIVNKFPEAPSINGDTLICSGTSINFTASANYADSLIWSLPTDWRINQGQGGDTLTVTAGSKNGSVCVTPTNVCGQALGLCLTVKVDSAPGKPGAITGEKNPLLNESYTYSINQIADADSYLWSTTSGNPEGTSNEISFIWNSVGNQQIQVKSQNNCGASELSTLEVTVREPVNALAGMNLDKLHLHPNPAQDFVTLALPAESNSSTILSITHLTGKLMYQEYLENYPKKGEIQLDISGLNEGLYLIILKTENAILTEKLIIQH